MGIGDYINRATDSAKQKVPSLSSAKQVCLTTYNYGGYAVSSIGKAVRSIPVPKIPEFVQDPENRDKIRGFASVLGQNAAECAFHESLKLFPGGGKDKKIKGLEAEIRRLKMESTTAKVTSSKKVELFKDSAMRTEHLKEPEMMNPQVFQAPEDVLRVFMMKSFIGSHLLDDLVVPGTGTRSTKK